MCRYAKDIDLKPKRLPNGLLSWIYPVITYPEGDIIDEAGLDCAMYLRILRFGVYLFFPLTIFCIIVVLPPNMKSNGIEAILAEQALRNAGKNQTSGKGDLEFSDFDHYSLSNVEAASPKMWAHLFAVYCVVLYTLWLLWRFNRESVLLRLLFLGNAKRGGPSHTVLVTDIPGISEAVSKALRDERAKKQEMKKMERDKSIISQKSVDVQLDDDSYAELPDQPRTATTSVASTTLKPQTSLRKGRVVSISEPPVLVVQQQQLQQQQQQFTPRAVPSVEKGGRSNVSASPFSDASAKSFESTADAELPGSSTKPEVVELKSAASASGGAAAGGGPAGPAGGASFVVKAGGNSRFNLRSILSSTASDAQYRLVVDDLDPKYAATGGKLELARVGKTNEEILKELQVMEKDDLVKGLPEKLGVDTRPLPPTRRNTKRYEYDLKTTVLDPVHEALETLRKGVTPQQLVAREFALVYGTSNVAAVNMIQDTSALEPLAEEYNQARVCQDLDDYLEMAKLRLKLRKALPQKQISILCARYQDMDYVKKFKTKWFVKVDAVEFWLERMKYLRERIKIEQAKCVRKMAPSAFVTFNTRMAQAVSANSLHSHDENAWRVQNAPAPFEVVWKNLSLTMPIKNGRLYLLWAAFWGMTIFFMVPVSFIQGMIEVPKLASIPVLGDIVTTPPIKQLLQAVIPGLVLKIFLALVPTILRIMAQLSGATSVSEIDFGVVKRFFLFQTVVVFFGSIILGSFFNQLKQWVKEPSSVIATLGKSIPMTSTFFITYLLVNGLGVKSFAFIRLPNFVIYWILSKFAGSPAARQRMWMFQWTNNGTTVVDHTIAMMLGLTFSCINPIVCPAALAYFLVNFLGETYNNVYVYRRQYESGGMLWKTVYNQVMVALYIMQITMLGLLSLKKFKFSPFMFPLIIFSITSHISTLQLFNRPWSVTALHDAAYMDMLEADQRRMTLLAAAREERKKKRDKIKRAYDDAVRQAENNDDPPPPYDTRLDEVPSPGYPGAGKAELLLLESIEGDGYALNSQEKREVEEMYMNPVFKVKLEEVERLEKLAEDVQTRLPRLNEWVAEYKVYRREVKKRHIKGDTEQVTPPKMPEDLTIYDADPNLQDSDDEEDAGGAAGGNPNSTTNNNKNDTAAAGGGGGSGSLSLRGLKQRETGKEVDAADRV
ncbi:ERD4-related membrane protein [Volvox carteri f. nagariensis]|uniref:ERD4-related membrane protein n=1 Tax=Volvox carteri f. nagariensis TaxID=3068 RepID=D8U8Q2_VOLCA|nr:ERD4-related membrane protein [Volvox carteri f. nagariensis]EFJ43788.1 ERD4-related membrane protein [Volvox carteri f. nagariensis]|eukprot:XP_002955034.1 ERD4-related membrane protein [Volvox carteri f. nagariensis]